MLIDKFGPSDCTVRPQRPNYGFFWSAIRWACDSNFSVPDFGRADLDNEGVRLSGQLGTVEAELASSTLRDPPAAVRTAGPFEHSAQPSVIRRVRVRELGELRHRDAA